MGEVGGPRSEADYSYLKPKAKGGHKGYIATYQGRKYMIKSASGYVTMSRPAAGEVGGRGSPEWSKDHELALEQIATKLFRKIIGEKFAPETELITKDESRPGERFLFSSKWISKMKDFSEWKDPALLTTMPYLTPLSKIITLAKILQVEDFKPEHLLIKSHEMKKESVRIIIVDCAANFIDCARFVEENRDLFEPVYKSTHIPALDREAVIETARQFCSLKKEEIDLILEDAKGIFSEAKIKEFRENLIKTQVQVRSYIEQVA